MKNQKGFAPILLILVLLVVVGAGVYYMGTQKNPFLVNTSSTPTPVVPPTPSLTPDETATWKTYTNQKYGFSLKYPKDYTLKENGDIIKIISPKTLEDMKDPYLEAQSEVTIRPQMTSNSLESVLGLPLPISFGANYFSSREVADHSSTYLGSITVDNKVGYQLRHMEASIDKYVLFQNSDGTYFVLDGSLPDQIAEIEPFDMIVNSLEFNK